MAEQQINAELSQWFSTYGMITAERILGKLQIILPKEDLLSAVKSPFSFYHRILQIPLKNVLTGIILQQASDYHVYCQKLFIDYLLSGEPNKPEESQGALTRESMEEERVGLVKLGEDFHTIKLAQDALIANSQASLKKIAKEWVTTLESVLKLVNGTFRNNNLDVKKNTVRKGLHHALIHFDLVNNQSQNAKYIFLDKFNDIVKISLVNELKDKLLDNLSELFKVLATFESHFEEFTDETNEMILQARSYRTQFYESILRVTDLIKLLPEYKIDQEQDLINREPLHFDKAIGDR